MHGSRFDQLARALARRQSRRAVAKTLAGGVLGGVVVRLGPPAVLAQTATPAASFDPGAVIFSDDFESGRLTKWADVHGVAIEQTEVASGHFAAEAKSAGAAAYARAKLGTTYPELYARVRFKVLRRDAGVYLLQFFTATATSLVAVYLSDQGKLGFRNDVAGQDAHSSAIVSSGKWHEIQVHARVAGAQGQVAIWLDGAEIKELAQPAALGTTPIGRFQIGESATGDTFGVAFDDVVLATQFIPATFPSTPAATANAKPPNATSSSAPAAPCSAGQTSCNGACVTLASDPRNCGQCGLVCAQGQTCANGACAAPVGCPTGQTVCGAGAAARCANLQTDPNNCGSCGTVCPAGQTCSGGACTGGTSGACPGGCGAGQACCNGSCVQLGDEANCRACGDACGQGQVCCSSATGCVDTTSDPNNCGNCGLACAQGQTCTNGTCTGGCGGGCGQGQACCGASCVTLGDEANCSACGDACSANQVCCSAATGCMDTSSDPNNCGNCGTACGQGQTCSGGACTGGQQGGCGGGCGQGQACCGGTCVFLGDEANCSGCGDACGQGQVCLNGSCQTQQTGCPAGQAGCGNGCVNLGDEVNCSQCGDACGLGQVCCNMSCQTSCS